MFSLLFYFHPLLNFCMKKILLAVLAFSIFQCLYSQTIEAKLNEWAKTNPMEKLYLHLDRESYLAGQHIWFKGYFSSGLMPSNLSSTMYVELLNNESSVIFRGAFPAYLGVSMGQLDIPEELNTGTYLIRAYSPIMLNQPGFNFYKRIAVFGKSSKKNSKAAPQEKPLLRFFPEGGNFIAGIINTVAFKATDMDGMPLNTEGDVLDEKGNVVTSFKTLHDGMGSFVLVPQPGSSYTANIKGTELKYPLPQQQLEGITFKVRSTSKDKQFAITQMGNNIALKPAYMIGQMGNQVLFKQLLNGDKKSITGVIPTTDLYSGILQLTVFNKDNMPLTERLTFIDNKEYILPGTIQADTLNTEARKRNHFSLLMKDTIIGNFSIAVTDADYDNATPRSQNIYSWLFLNSDIKGYVHNSAYYFSSASDSVRAALDLVMMTNGWSRFKWTDIAQNKLPLPKYKDRGYIDLSGRINIEGTKRPLANKDIIMLVYPADTSKVKRGGMPRFLHTDSLGQFKMDSVIFYDKMKLLFSEVRGKKSKYISVRLNEDSLNKKFAITPISIPFDSSQISNASMMASAYYDYMKAEGITLEAVTVKARQKSETEKLEEQYSSALFSNNVNGRVLDLRNEMFSGDIFQYLQGRVPGLTVSGTPGEYKINYRDGGFGTGNVSLYLDEMPTDANMIEAIPLNQIAFVKLLPNSVATFGGGTALAIYMKKGADLNAVIPAANDIITYSGYTIVKEFYNPNYDKQPDDSKVDNRLTISWMPNIYLAKVNPIVPIIFYNTDRTKRYKIVAEGYTNDGRMLMLEKIIDPTMKQ